MSRKLQSRALPPIVLSVLSFLCAASGSAAATVKPRIAVMGVSAEKLAPDVREKIDAAVAGGLAASGADVVDAGETAKKIVDKSQTMANSQTMAGCETATCLTGVAQVTGARYLVRGAVEVDGRSYAIRLEMIDGATGAVIESREDRCEICTESEVYETAGMTASALKAAVSRRKVGAASADETPRPVPSLAADGTAGAAGASPPVIGPVATVTSGPLADRPVWRKLSWIGIGAGVAAVGAGIFLLSIDGEQTCTHAPGDAPADRCELSYQTKAGGITLLGAGVLAAAAGAAVLIGHF